MFHMEAFSNKFLKMNFVMAYQLEDSVLKAHKVGGVGNLDVWAWHDVVGTQEWIGLLPDLCEHN